VRTRDCDMFLEFPKEREGISEAGIFAATS